MSSAARAEGLPWLADRLADPFGADRKASNLVAPKVRPPRCPEAPDLGHRLTFDEVVTAALCRNPDTRAAYLSLLAQAAGYEGSYSAYLPTVTATAERSRSAAFSRTGITPGDVRATGLSGQLTLYDFGQREFKIEAAEQVLIAAGHSYNSTMQGMIASALQGYFRLLTSQNAVGAARAAEGYAKESYEAAKLKHQIGQAPLADELQARGSYSQARLATEQADNQLSLDRAALALLMGLQADAEVAVAEMDDSALTNDPFGGRVEALMEEAKQQRADLLAGRAQLEGAKSSYQALKRADLATVAAGVNLGYNDIDVLHRHAHSQSIGVSVSVPIFTGFSQTYSERQAQEQLEAQQEQLAKTELTVGQDVWNAWHNYQTAKLSWETSWDLIASATQLKDVALGRYKEGLGTILDVLNAQTQFTGALQSQLQSRYNLLTTRVDLVRAVGVLDLDTMRPPTAPDEPAAAQPVTQP